MSEGVLPNLVKILGSGDPNADTDQGIEKRVVLIQSKVDAGKSKTCRGTKRKKTEN